MATATLKRQPRVFGPESNGILVTPQEFDRADYDECWRYELIRGVLIVSPLVDVENADMCAELGFWLRLYQHEHPHGGSLDKTLFNRFVYLAQQRRWVDRVI